MEGQMGVVVGDKGAIEDMRYQVHEVFDWAYTTTRPVPTMAFRPVISNGSLWPIKQLLRLMMKSWRRRNIIFNNPQTKCRWSGKHCSKYVLGFDVQVQLQQWLDSGVLEWQVVCIWHSVELPPVQLHQHTGLNITCHRIISSPSQDS